MLRQYGAGIEHIKTLAWPEGAQVLKKAAEQEQESRAWDMWVAAYPHMTDDSFIPFDEFLAKMKKPAPTKKGLAEIITRAEQIKRADQEEVEKGAAVSCVR